MPVPVWRTSFLTYLELQSDLERGASLIQDHGRRAAAPVAIQVEDIGTVFTQLTTNACEALLARYQDERSFEPTLSLSTEAIGNHLLVHVDDNGEGVAPANRDKIFTPFFTTRAKAHNIGLGLTTSYDILVHGYDGDLRLETSPNGGTRFTAELPLESLTHHD